MGKRKQYTLMIIPGSNSRVRKFVISEKILKVGVVLAGVLSVAQQESPAEDPAHDELP